MRFTRKFLGTIAILAGILLCSTVVGYLTGHLSKQEAVMLLAASVAMGSTSTGGYFTACRTEDQKKASSKK